MSTPVQLPQHLVDQTPKFQPPPMRGIPLMGPQMKKPLMKLIHQINRPKSKTVSNKTWKKKYPFY